MIRPRRRAVPELQPTFRLQIGQTTVQFLRLRTVKLRTMPLDEFGRGFIHQVPLTPLVVAEQTRVIRRGKGAGGRRNGEWIVPGETGEFQGLSGGGSGLGEEAGVPGFGWWVGGARRRRRRWLDNVHGSARGYCGRRLTGHVGVRQHGRQATVDDAVFRAGRREGPAVVGGARLELR